MDIHLTDEELANIFAMAMFPLLDKDQGVAVHHKEKGFVVAKVFDEDHQEIQVKIMHDDEILQYPDRAILILHDEPVGNA